MEITKDMTIEEVVQRFPDTVRVFSHFGVACLGCSAAHYDNIEQGAALHGLNADDLLKALNACIAGRA